MTSTHLRLYSIARRTLVGLAAVSSLAGAANLPAPPAEAAGLVRQHAPGLGEYAVLPGSSFAGYHRVLVAPVEVAFVPKWAEQHRELRADDIERLRQDFATLAREELQRGFASKGGLAAVDAAGAQVLEVRASVVDLNIAAPEVRDAAVRRDFVYSAGEATLVVEVRDSVTGKLLARAADHREMRNYYPDLRLANSVTNDAEARDLVDAWTRSLRRQLFTARADRKGS